MNSTGAKSTHHHNGKAKLNITQIPKVSTRIYSIPIRRRHLEMAKQLPNTNILWSSTCETNRGKNKMQKYKTKGELT